ncbi:SusD/RagB family nutrient-binding outer membrane lipoprotein [Pedobacter sp. UC225_61]|uniref:SusD/RagB family nutrient-binding outer membrane lipoprotein n=1 Tax=Pedobacter sp. UC225_61 TaxID=3374623 RepID=UPI0037ACEBCC
MKKFIYSAALLILISVSGCKKWLDVNVNPNNPQEVSPNLYLGPILTNLTFSQQYDGRYIGKYIQNWAEYTASDTWDRHGYLFNSQDPASEQWRTVYFLLGYNLIDMMRISEAEERWDLLGIGYVIKALGWQHLTDTHGELILKQAFDQSRKTFDYDSQEDVYNEIQRLLDLAIVNLKRTDGKVSQAYLASSDAYFQGNKDKWLKFAYGLKALSLNHLSNKGAKYKPDDIIAAVDLAMAGNADNAKFKFSGLVSTSSNFYGPQRGNLNTFRQTTFFVNLMNGTQFNGVVDPRLKRLLFPSTDGNVYGIEPTYGYNSSTAAQRPSLTFWGSASSGTNLSGNYIFNDKSSYPVMTYSELQFIKAEAAFRKGDKPTALDAYKKGIDAHIDFVNQANAEAANATVTQITTAEKTAFLTSAAIPTNPADLKLGDIMLQKYIALWGWGINETWADLRRYHYIDADPSAPTATQVYRGFTIPAADRIFSENNNKPAYRLRPRYNSEWVWNIDAFEKIGGKRLDYHTIPIWIATP